MQEMTVVLDNALKGELPDFLVLDSMSEKSNGFGGFLPISCKRVPVNSNISLLVFCDLVTLCWL